MRTLTQLLFNILALNNFVYYLFSSYKSDISEEEYSDDWSSEDWGEGEEDAVGELIGSLSNHDGNAKENVTLKMTSKYFKFLRDSFNSFNLSNVAKQSGS